MKVQIDPRVAFCSIVAAALLAGCDDDSSKKEQPAQPAPAVECTSNAHCVDRTDGKTECNMVKNVCVKPSQQPTAKCGNNKIDGSESCDGADLGNKTCKSWSDNFVGGTLTCDSSCGFDTSGCVECTEDDLSLCDQDQICSNNRCTDDVPQGGVCGDGTVDEDEDCEDGKAITATCADFGDFVAGDLSCDPEDCTYDISECVECTESDTSLCDSGEVCVNGFCREVQVMCGNGKLEAGESCDGSALDGKSCADLGEFVSGDLACNSACRFDTSACVECTAENTSKCDSGEICSESGHCVDPGHEISCGDGLVEGDEQCDDANLNGKSCADIDPAHPAGKLICKSTCEFDTIGCLECSDNSHCAGRDDNKTVCDNSICVEPGPVVIPKVVISQIYTGGGLSGANYNTKFVELLNIDEGDADISNWSIQYGLADKNEVKSVCKLPEDEKTKKLPKGGYYLVALKPGSNGSAIPEPDAKCDSVNPNQADGKIFLVNSSEKLATTTPGVDEELGIVDMVGYGSANYAEGNAIAALSAKKAGLRKKGGCIDTDNNASDFEINSANPRNFSSALNLCDGSEDPVCGNGLLETGEVCDGSLFEASKTACKDWDSRYVSGDVLCNACAIDYSNCKEEEPAVCGNETLDSGEDCDGTLFKGNKTDCADWEDRFISGKVSCNDCIIDYSDCKEEEPVVCGDNVLDISEACDGDLFKDNKTACKDYDAVYISGYVKCIECAIDYSDCKTEEPAACDNNRLDSTEDCDGELFRDNKKLCADWKPGEFNQGEVTCNACNIDYSGCSFVDPASCLDGQVWSDKYATCVYPIATKDDLIKLGHNWNENGGREAYPTSDGSDPVFLLMDDIDPEMNRGWVSIGTLGAPFEGVFYGDGHTIGTTITNGRGLFEYTSYAKIQDFTIKINATGSAQMLLAANVDHGSFKNITIAGTWKYNRIVGAAYGVLGTINAATFDNIKVDLNSDVAAYGDYYVSLFMKESKLSKFNNISLNGKYKLTETSYGNTYAGIAYSSDSDRFENIEINMDIDASAFSKHQVDILFVNIKGTTVIDRVFIKKAAVTKKSDSFSQYINDARECTKCVITNVEDNAVFGNTNRTYFIYYLRNIDIANALINGNFSATYHDWANSVYNENIIWAKQPETSYSIGGSYHVFYESHVENGDVTPEKMNDYLNSSIFLLPKGSYLPWYKDTKGRFHLKFDAAADELYVNE